MKSSAQEGGTVGVKGRSRIGTEEEKRKKGGKEEGRKEGKDSHADV